MDLALETAARRVTDRADAFRGLTGRHLASAYRLAAVILGDPTEAEDAVHDAALAAWRRWDSLRDEARFEAWFGRILVNTCRDRLRQRGRRRVVDIGAELESAFRVGDASAQTADRDALGRAFAELDPDARIVVVLRFYLDLTVDDIAARMGIPSGTVKSRLHHALRRMRSTIEPSETREVTR